MKKSALTITLINGLVTAIQIVGQIIVARIFGAKIELDAFVSAVTIPTMLTSVIAATLSDAFLPDLKKKQIENEKKANVYFFKMAFLVGFIVFLITFGIDLFSAQLISLLFGARGGPFVLFTDQLMMYMLYTLPFTVLGVLFNSYLYSRKQFFVPSLAYLAGSILNLTLIITLSPSIGIVSMVVAFISAIFLQLFFVFPYKIASYSGATFKSFWDGETKSQLIKLFISWSPLVISAIIMRFDAILTRSFAARLPEGYIVYTNLVAKLFGGLVGIMTIGIQTVFFPHLVELVHLNDFNKANIQVRKAKTYGFLLTLCTVLIVVFVAPFFMRFLLTGGKFSSENVEILISLFPYFVIPATGWGIAQIFAQPIIAIGKQYILTLVNILAVCLAWLSANYTYRLFGGLPAISVGLIVLAFAGIIGAEIIWKLEIKRLQKNSV